MSSVPEPVPVSTSFDVYNGVLHIFNAMSGDQFTLTVSELTHHDARELVSPSAAPASPAVPVNPELPAVELMLFSYTGEPLAALPEIQYHDLSETAARLLQNAGAGIVDESTATAAGGNSPLSKMDRQVRWNALIPQIIKKRGLRVEAVHRSVRLSHGQSVSLPEAGADAVVLIAVSSPLHSEQIRHQTRIECRRYASAGNADNAAKTDDLPPPLGTMRTELRVSRATARAYEVKEGELIQIIDVEGKQCSDFLAFHRGSVASDGGTLSFVDATTTRTLNGTIMPAPLTLYNKFFDGGMRPLVEVVRDTVGRHDAFALACTAKYYNDLGYVGHPNCTDNFNNALKEFGVRSRPGWPAINFFYNTQLNPGAYALSMDEPWSRPGDYVLLRATSDLLCASSACPDDVDAANGWNPTDIHVRIYPADLDLETLPGGAAYRITPHTTPTLTRHSGFFPRLSQLTRSFSDYRNFLLPTCYTDYGPIDDYWACRERAVVMDLSPLRKFEVLGPDAETLLQRTLCRNVRKLAVGAVSYTAMCNATGSMIDDGTVFRFGPEGFRWVCGNDFCGEWLRLQAEALGLRCVHIRHVTDQLHNLSLQGPLSRSILKKLRLWTPSARPNVDELKWFRFTSARLHNSAGIPLLLSRTGYSGELGYELWCHPSHAVMLWDALMEAGREFGLAPCGLAALDMLRIESGLIFAGYEFADGVDPFEAGIGFAVDLDKGGEDFVGRAALQQRSAHPQRVLVGLEMGSNEAVGHGDCVHPSQAFGDPNARFQIGVVTSGTKSPVLMKNIALARVAVEYSKIGTPLEIGKLDGQQKRIAATVVRFPFYDPDKKRPRA